ncbi:MAG: hypothetical protein ACRDGW_02620 [Actinomycetota bacterium]
MISSSWTRSTCDGRETPSNFAHHGTSRRPDAGAGRPAAREHARRARALHALPGGAARAYRALADGESVTSSQLADRTGTVERYVRGWLEHHAASGLLEVDDPAAEALARRYRMPP